MVSVPGEEANTHHLSGASYVPPTATECRGPQRRGCQQGGLGGNAPEQVSGF